MTLIKSHFERKSLQPVGKRTYNQWDFSRRGNAGDLIRASLQQIPFCYVEPFQAPKAQPASLDREDRFTIAKYERVEEDTENLCFAEGTGLEPVLSEECHRTAESPDQGV